MKRSLLLFLCAWSGALFANPVELKDREGRVISAEILKLEGDELVIQRADKQLFRLSLAKLSPDSQELVRQSLGTATTPAAAAVTPASTKATNDARMIGLGLNFNGPKPDAVRVNLSGGEPSARVTRRLSPDDSAFDIGELGDGDYTISFDAEGYASQWYRLSIKNGRSSPRKLDVDLRKKRYVVIRYAINPDASPELSGPDLYQGVAAFSDNKYGNPQHFMGWYVRQASPGEVEFGDDFSILWKWMTPDSGMCLRKQGFDAVTSAKKDKFSHDGVKLTKGLVFTCRSSYTRNQRLYGKFQIVDIVDVPPADMDAY